MVVFLDKEVKKTTFEHSLHGLEHSHTTDNATRPSTPDGEMFSLRW